MGRKYKLHDLIEIAGEKSEAGGKRILIYPLY